MGSNIINKYKTSKDGRSCYVELKKHFQNATYLENKATAANRVLTETKYYGERRNFTLETYYTLMSQCFLDLEQSDPVHHLTEEQKITKFESGLVEEKAISYSIQAKVQWNTTPIALRNFDAYYNIFSASMNKHNLLINTNSQRRSRISQVGTGSSPNAGQGRGRGYGRDRGRGRGRGRSGRGGRAGRYNPYQLARTHVNFVPEARSYQPSEYRALTAEQKQAIINLKVEQGWLDGNTPPPGFILDANGRAQPSSHLVAAVRASVVNEVSTSQNNDTNDATVPLPPIPTNMPPPSLVLPVVMTNASNADQNFGRPGNRVRSSDSSTIASVTINGRAHQGPVFDAQGNQIA